MNRDMRADRPEAVRPPRVWTAKEANERIASLGALLSEMKGWAVRRADLVQELERLAAFWGAELDAPDHADHGTRRRLEAEVHELSHRLEGAVRALRAEGIEVKELQVGLVDFYTVQDGELSFLCWRSDEPTVSFFHPLTGGYRNRRPVP